MEMMVNQEYVARNDQSIFRGSEVETMSRAGRVVLPDRGTVAHGFRELKPHYQQMNKRLRVGDVGWTPQNFGAYIS